MLTEDWRIEVQDTTHPLKSNQPLLLNIPGTVWRVKSGSLALFTIQMEQGLPRGRRRYLFSVKSGELMIPSPVSERQILAVALEDTELVQLAEADFLDWVTDTPERAFEQLESWVHRLGAALSGLVSPTLPTPITTCGLLDAGEVFQPAQGTVVWVQILQGQARLLGCEPLVLSPRLGRIPLQSHLWLQADGIVEIDLCSKRSLTQATTLLRGLNHLQVLVFRGIQQLEQQELRQEAIQFRERKQLNRRVITQALNQLTAVFQTADKPQALMGQPVSPPADLEAALLIAAGAVGHAQGISICPPVPSDQRRRLQDTLTAIAQASHTRMRRVTLREGWWQKDGGALLSYRLEDGCPVALLPCSATAYELFDPIQNTRLRCNSAMADQLAPTAYSFYRPFPEHLMPLKLLQFSMQGHWQELIIVLLTGMAATLLGMVTPQATALLIDSAIPDANRLLLLQIGAGLLATVFGMTLFQLVQGVAVLRLGAAADAVTQAAIWDRLLNLKAAFFLQYSSGDLNNRVAAVSQIRQKLSSTLLKSLFASLFSFLNLGLLFYYSMPLAWMAVGVALINIGVTLVSGILTLRQIRPLLEYQGKLFGTMVEIINGVSKFRVAGAESRAFAYWGKHYSQQLKLSLSTQGIEDNLAVINTLLTALTPAVLFAGAALLLQQPQQQGGLSTGSFLAFNAAFGTFIGGATSLSTTVIDVLEVWPIWQRVEPVLAAVPEVNDRQANPGRISGQVTVDHAVFRYRTDGALTLDDVSIKAEPGEFIALVGPSGSGKSTLLRLLLGFDQPESGTVSFDGQDLAGLDVHAVRRQLGVVLQNSRLMLGSIFDNISSNALITMDEAWNAARLAGLSDDIAAMPMQMHTMVSEGGTNLSGGQRQRLLIARALALRPRILLFDEATSALDNRTQAIVSESLERLKVTRIVVAHRLSTIRNADRIYVLQNGRVVQQGNFEELAEQPGLFEQLIKRQQE